MAVQIIVRMFDDLDGTCGDDVATVRFGLDGVRYEIDLNKAHEEKLRAVFAPFLPVARRVDQDAADISYFSRGELIAHIRCWAQDNGFSLCDRGRIPTAAIVAFKTAHENGRGYITRMCDGLLAHPPAD